MNLVEEVMEYEVRGLERLLTLMEYKNNIFGTDLLDTFERIIEKFSSSNTEIEIDKEIRKIQLLIFRTETEKNNPGLISFMTGKIKHFLNNYLVAYIILKRLKDTPSIITLDTEDQKNKKISNAINLVRNTELEFEHVKEFIKYMLRTDV